MAGQKFPPGPKSLIGFNHLMALYNNSAEFLEEVSRYNQDISHFRVGRQHLYLLNNPEYIKEVLVTNAGNFVKSRSAYWLKPILGNGLLTSDGEFHLSQRRLVQPAFHRRRIEAFAGVMVQYAGEAASRWEEGEKIDINDEMMRLTLRIVAKTLFDTEVEQDAGTIGNALTDTLEWYHNYDLPFGEWINKLPLPSVRRFNRARATLDAIVYRMIDEHRRSGIDNGDLLSMLLLAQEEGHKMDDEQVRDQTITLLLAGHETTSLALTWSWYLLSQNPEVANKLHIELDHVLQGRSPSYDDISRLNYTNMVFSEALRLYPPAWAMGRSAIKDCQIGGYHIPAGSIVLVSQFVTHRDPRYFPDPLRFDPERMRPELAAERPKFSYFPFGGGNRLCIGEPFAWMEGILLLATLAQRWQMNLDPFMQIELMPRVTLRSKFGMEMWPVRRRVLAPVAVG